MPADGDGRAKMAWAGTEPAQEDFETRIAQLAPHLDVFLPEGKGPFPTTLQLPGCGGKKPFQADWARRAQAAGWAAVVIDSYAHRGVTSLQAYTTICTGLAFWGRERAGDFYAAVEWARRQAWCDPSRLAGAGWSHGGWTLLDALALRPGPDAARATGLRGLPEEPLAGVVGAFLVYPYAGVGCLARTQGLRIDARPMALVGSADVIVGGIGVKRALDAMSTPGEAIRVEYLVGATHAFDEVGARDLRVRYSRELTERAHGLYQSYLHDVGRR